MANGIGPIANLLGKVDANGALLVAMSGGSVGPVDAISFTGGSSINGATTNTLKLRATGSTDILTLSSTAVTSSVPMGVSSGADLVQLTNDGTTAKLVASGVDNLFIDSGSGNGLRLGVNGSQVVDVGGSGITFQATSFGLHWSDVSVSRGAAGVVTPASNQSYGFGANPIMTRTAPTIASGFGTSPSIPNSNGTASFSVNVGTGGVATGGVITLPAASNGWNIHCQNLTSAASLTVEKTAGTTTSVTLASYSRTTGLLTAFNASDVLECIAMAR